MSEETSSSRHALIVRAEALIALAQSLHEYSREIRRQPIKIGKRQRKVWLPTKRKPARNTP